VSWTEPSRLQPSVTWTDCLPAPYSPVVENTVSSLTLTQNECVLTDHPTVLRSGVP